MSTPKLPVSPDHLWKQGPVTNEVQYTGYARGPDGERLSAASPLEMGPEVRRLAEEAFEPEVAKLRRDRDELVEALDALAKEFWEYASANVDASGPYYADDVVRKYRALIQRVRGGG